MGFIYTLVDPITGADRYIGFTIFSLEKRLRGHLNEKSKSHKANWIRKLKSKGLIPKIELIDEIPNEEVYFWEMYYISLFKSWGVKLTNSTIGGDGTVGMKLREETKEKLRIINTGKKRSPESIEKNRVFMLEYYKTHTPYFKGKKQPFSKESLERITASAKERAKKLIGVPLTEETKRKISESKKGKSSWNKGIPWSEDVKKKVSKTKKGNSLPNSGSFKKGENPYFGKKRPPETIQRMKEGWIKRKEKYNKLKQQESCVNAQLA